MRVGIIQSSFIPWRGYFDFIASVDLFIFHDDIQYTKGDWRNRNCLKTEKGKRWLTVPVHHTHQSQRICDTEVVDDHDWRGKHLRLWKENYSRAPFFDDVIRLLGDMERGKRGLTISQLNVFLIRSICGFLGIGTPLRMSQEFSPVGQKTDRLLDILKKAGATEYLSGPRADAYLDKGAFAREGIRLEYKTYDYAPYPQFFGAFEGAVSILDMIAHCGVATRDALRSATPNVLVI
ncbi:MAG: WbqC family protein [Candidatus Riflebacteria bacterium]|nr:WbqC family protein [Candidatus Riflebacteria bacterium]